VLVWASSELHVRRIGTKDGRVIFVYGPALNVPELATPLQRPAR
jgi:hypothetical protein